MFAAPGRKEGMGGNTNAWRDSLDRGRRATVKLRYGTAAAHSRARVT